MPKAVAAAEDGVMSHVTFTCPNEAELSAMATAVLRRKGLPEDAAGDASRPPAASYSAAAEAVAGRDNYDEKIRQNITVLLDVGVEVVLVTAGSRGIFFGTIDIETGSPAVVHFPANVVPPAAIANTTGAGDSFAGGFVCAASREWPLDQAVALGQAAASLALYSHAPVSSDLTMEALAQPVLQSMSPPPALKPRGQTRIFTQVHVFTTHGTRTLANESTWCIDSTLTSSANCDRETRAASRMSVRPNAAHFRRGSEEAAVLSWHTCDQLGCHGLSSSKYF